MTRSLPRSLPSGRPHTHIYHSVLLLLLNAFCVLAELNNDTSPTSIFRSRPDLHPPIIDVRILRPELVTPGYIFLAPYRNRDPGPYIYDNYGDLVWSGAGESGPKTAHAPHTCTYKGEVHLCYFSGEQHQGFARGHGTIMDKNYRVVKSIDSAGAGASADMHEFRITPYSNGTSVLLTVYQPRMWDLTQNPRFRIKGGMGWIVEGVFQEIEIDTGKVLFEWRSTDHLDPSLSYTYPSSTDTSGSGLNEDAPWDYFHINSIDKNSEGDYLISARHMAGIYKLSGVDGSIMWELGGANPTIKCVDWRFSSQHHARWLKENSTHTMISMFDNGSNAYNQTNKFSHAYIVSINHMTNEAVIVKSWGAPEDGGLLSTSQGDIQVLPGGNVHIGWGEHAYSSEHTWDGAPVQYFQLARRESNVMIYRSYKFNWTGTPLTKPALWTYARSEDARSGMVFYVSWNGATEVASWNFYVSNSSSGPFELVKNVKRRGFETSARFSVNHWAFAEALDADGRALERSVVSRTFMPSDTLSPYCDDNGCQRPDRVDDESYNAEEAERYRVDEGLLSSSRGFNTSQYYAQLSWQITMSSLKRGGAVDVGGLVLGMLFAGLVAVLAGASLLVLVRSRAIKRVWPLRTRVHGLVKYMRLQGDGAEKDDEGSVSDDSEQADEDAALGRRHVPVGERGW